MLITGLLIFVQLYIFSNATKEIELYRNSFNPLNIITTIRI